jgi:hypothetical protein
MRLTAIVTCLLLAANAPLALAAADSPKADSSAAAKESWSKMSAEEKAAAQKKAKSKWDAMTPEQKAEAKKRNAERSGDPASRSTQKKEAGKPPADLPAPSAGPR